MSKQHSNSSDVTDASLLTALQGDILEQRNVGSFLSSDLLPHLDSWRAAGRTPFRYTQFDVMYSCMNELCTPAELAFMYFFLRGFVTAEQLQSFRFLPKYREPTDADPLEADMLRKKLRKTKKKPKQSKKDDDGDGVGDDATSTTQLKPVPKPSSLSSDKKSNTSPWGNIGAKARKKQLAVGTLKPKQIAAFCAANGVASMDEYFKKYSDDPEEFRVAFEKFQEAEKKEEVPKPLTINEDEEEDEEDEATSVSAVWKMPPKGHLRRQAFEAGENNVLKALSSFSLMIGRVAGEPDSLVLQKGMHTLSLTEVLLLIHDLEYIFSAPRVFNYSFMVYSMLQAAAKVMIPVLHAEVGIDEASLSPLEEIETRFNTATQPGHGEEKRDPEQEFMIPFEICFQANMAQREVSLPDPYNIPARHKDVLIERYLASNFGEFCLLYYFSCMRVACHEFIHCVQHVLLQTDSNPFSWSAEHDASYLSHSLFHEISTLDKDIFPPGLSLAVLAEANERATLMLSEWSPATLDAYIDWRDSIGTHAPSTRVSQDPSLCAQFKSMVACECGVDDHDLFVEQVKLLFKDRFGDVYKKQLIIPAPLIQLQPIGTFQLAERTRTVVTPEAAGRVQQVRDTSADSVKFFVGMLMGIAASIAVLAGVRKVLAGRKS